MSFKGLAIVDNNTEEDWDNVAISVVTGEPITFSTDLAESKIPRRKHVNVVQDRADGPVETDSFSGAESVNMVRSMKSAPPVGTAGNQARMCSFTPEMAGGDSAIQAETNIKEVGDFSIFTAKDLVSIASNDSAIIPVFDAVLKEAKTVLHYKQNNHATRSYRSIQFKNETEHSLGRGVCTVNLQGLYAGSCIIPAMKQGEEQLLPYALETGVKVSMQQKSGEFTIRQVSSKGGAIIIEQIQKIETTYTIANLKKEDFEFYLDYASLTNSNLVGCKLNGSELVGKTSGSVVRYDFNLPASKVAVAVVTETQVNSSSIEVNEDNYDWFYNSYIQNNGPLSQIESLNPVIAVCEEINDCNHEIEVCEEKISKLTKKQERLRANIVASGERDEITANWRKELVSNETTLTDLEETELPGLEETKVSLEKMISKMLKGISFNLKI